MKKKYVYLIVSLVAIFPLVVLAASQTNARVGQDEIINHNYFATGKNISIAGTINGDVFIAGDQISITGTINGDVFAVGQSVTIDGAVSGGIKAVGQTVLLRNSTGANVYLFGNSLNLDKTSSVDGHLTAFGNTVTINGPINGNLKTSGSLITINNKITGSVEADRGVDLLILGAGAVVNGDLSYASKKEAEITSGALIKGETNFNRYQTKTAVKAYFAGDFLFGKVIEIFSLALVGLLLISLLPKYFSEIKKKLLDTPGKWLGYGLLWLIAWPIAGMLLLMTIIGIPLGLILLAVYLPMLYLAKVIAAVVYGQLIAEHFKLKIASVWNLALGAVVFVILTSLPFIGWLFTLLSILWAIGLTLNQKNKLLRQYK